MKSRGKINLIIDLILFVSLALMGGTGLLIKYALPPGRIKILTLGENIDKIFLGLNRHEWGNLHLAASYVFIVFIVLHLLFHWKVLSCLIRRALPSPVLGRALIIFLAIVCAGLFLFGLLVKPERREGGDFLHRHHRQKTASSLTSGAGIAQFPTPRDIAGRPGLKTGPLVMARKGRYPL